MPEPAPGEPGADRGREILALLGDGTLSAAWREAEVQARLPHLDERSFKDHYYGFLTTAAAHRGQDQPVLAAIERAMELNGDAEPAGRRSAREAKREAAGRQPLLQRILGR
jgi:hypothetical protein